MAKGSPPGQRSERRGSGRRGWGARVALGLVAALCGALAAGAAYTVVAVRQAEAAYPPVGAFVAVEGVRLHYVEAGVGPPVVLVHGADGVLQDYTTSIFAAVAREGRALAFDRPGHGYSGRPPDAPLTVGLNARLLHAALDALGVERPLLVGHSYGGAVALRYALDYPDDVAGVVTLGGAAYPGGGLPHPRVAVPGLPIVGPLYLRALLVPLDRLAGAAEPERAVATAAEGAGTEGERPAGPDAVGRADAMLPTYAVVGRALGARPDQFAAYAEEMRAVNADLAAQASHYPTLRVPLTIVAGGADRVVAAERHAVPLQQAVPGARLIMLPDAGHWLHHTHPAAVLDAIREGG
jgi:pimeloyl-ACP methyl ester carboxylesterase